MCFSLRQQTPPEQQRRFPHFFSLEMEPKGAAPAAVHDLVIWSRAPLAKARGPRPRSSRAEAVSEPGSGRPRLLAPVRKELTGGARSPGCESNLPHDARAVGGSSSGGPAMTDRQMGHTRVRGPHAMRSSRCCTVLCARIAPPPERRRQARGGVGRRGCVGPCRWPLCCVLLLRPPF